MVVNDVNGLPCFQSHHISSNDQLTTWLLLETKFFCHARQAETQPLTFTGEDKTGDLKDQIQLVHGKGLRIQNLHPSDQGVYVCEASNLMGAVTAAANLTVSEPPVITVKPQAYLTHKKGAPVTLQCMVTGSPKPAVYWILEEEGR